MSARCFTWFCWSCYDVNGINKRLLQIICLDPLNSLQGMKHNDSPDSKLHPDKSVQLKGAAAFFFLFFNLINCLLFGDLPLWLQCCRAPF